jgi:hypothetical protein
MMTPQPMGNSGMMPGQMAGMPYDTAYQQTGMQSMQSGMGMQSGMMTPV